jgi:hypothetical protein
VLVPVSVDMMIGRQWLDAVRQRCFVLWCGRGNRNASRTAWLYRQERPDGERGPSPATVRRWSAEEDWSSWAGEEVPPMRGWDLHQWQTMWFRQVARQMESAFRAERDILRGAFDGDPAAGVEALTHAKVTMQHLLAQPGVRALMLTPFRGEKAAPVFFSKRERQAWERLQQRHGGRQRIHSID